MSERVLVGTDAELLLRDQISQHTAGVDSSLSVFDAKSAVSAWLEVIRGIEELINLPQFGLPNGKQALALLSLPLDHLDPPGVAHLQRMLADQFDDGVARRFIHTVLRSAAIGLAFRQNGIESGNDFRTLAGVISYFQSRRRQMLALLYWMPHACRGLELVDPLDAINVFLPIVEHSCVSLTSFHRDLVLLRVYEDFELVVGPERCRRNYSYDILDSSSLEPERMGITEIPRDSVDISVLENMAKVDARRVFSVSELYNDLLLMEASYAKFNLGETAFGVMGRFIVTCTRYARDDYYVELSAAEFEHIFALSGLSASTKQQLVYLGANYAAAINSFAPFIVVKERYVTTVTLLSRFAYNYKTACLNKMKRFQILSGFVFERQVKTSLVEQGFIVADIKRIVRKEFDVVAQKDGVIYNVQCKNNLVDLARMEERPDLFARYNKRLERYYANALLKEEGREMLLKQKLGLQTVKHIVLSKFPVATKNPRIMAFREMDEFGRRFGDPAQIP